MAPPPKRRKKSVGSVAEAEAKFDKQRDEAMENAKTVDRTSLGWTDSPREKRLEQEREVAENYGPYEKSNATRPARRAKAKRTRNTRDPAKVAEMEHARSLDPHSVHARPHIKLEIYLGPPGKKKR